MHTVGWILYKPYTAYVKLIYDDRGQNSFACFQCFVKVLRISSARGGKGLFPGLMNVLCLGLDVVTWMHIHKSSSSYILNLCTSLYVIYNGKIKDKTKKKKIKPVSEINIPN